MNYKYLGEAVALLGIAYSIMRWLARNVPDADAPGRPRMRITLGRFALPRQETAADPAVAVPPDPRRLAAAATAFGITPEALARMDQREQALLVSAHASTHPPAPGDAATEGG